jgi:pilus assembly protein CpaB
MRAKSMVLILIALGCGLVASIAISQVLERGAGRGGSKIEMVQIYVATSDIDVNEELTAENVRVEDWPKSKVPEGSITSFDKIEMHYARTRLYEGEPILNRMVADEITGPAIKIPEGHRVCSINVEMDTAVSYLVKPGDRVDIFGYFRQSKDVPTTGTRQILSNVRVFAVNSETDQEVDEDGQTIVAKTVSVLVKQKQVAKLMLATELGTLRLALRHPNEDGSQTAASTESASIESLFGSRSEAADEAPVTPPTAAQVGATANGLMNFLAGLKRSAPANQVMTTVSGPPTAAWQMTVLTPSGGEEFTWTDVEGLPVSGPSNGGTQPSPSRRLASPAPTSPAPTSWPPAPSAADVDRDPFGGDPAEADEPAEVEQDEEDNVLPPDGGALGDG